MNRETAVSLGWIATLVVLATGCTQGARLNPVQGKVLYQGQPLAGALVSFHPQDSQGDPPTGVTKEDGTFSVATGQLEGARAGTYRIAIRCDVPSKKQPEGMSMGMPETEDLLKGAFGNVTTVTIKDGPNELEPFDLK